MKRQKRKNKTCSDHLQTQTSLSIFMEQKKKSATRANSVAHWCTHVYLYTEILLFYFTTLTVVVQHRTILLEMTPFHSHVHAQTCHVDGGMTVVFIFMLFFSVSFLSHYTLYCVSHCAVYNLLTFYHVKIHVRHIVTKYNFYVAGIGKISYMKESMKWDDQYYENLS